MRKIIFICLLLNIGVGYSQNDRAFFHTELDIIIPRNEKVVYSYKGGNTKLNEKVLWGANFSYNYELFKNFSVGALTGLTYLSNPSITSLKIGGVLRYTFIRDFQANTFLQITGNIPVTSAVKTSMGEVRFGFSMPIAKLESFDLTLSAYVMYLRYDLNKPLFLEEVPESLEYRGTGLSLGARF